MTWNVEHGQIRKLVFAGFVTLISIIVLHQPWLSLQNAIIGGSAVTIPQMAFLKASVGFFTSLAILAICRLAVGKLSFGSIAIAIVVQILWIEFEWNFSVRTADVGELVIRFAEELGALLAGGSLIGFLRLWKKGFADSRTQQ
jgi:hypothetical protein